MIVNNKSFEQFLPAAEIAGKVKEMGAEITRDYQDKDPLFIPTLNGAFMFAADLLREVDLPCKTSFVKMASYDEMQSTGNIKELIGLGDTIFNRNVVLVEDILDTGRTIEKLLDKFSELGPRSLEVATLLLKKDKAGARLKPRYVGFEIEDEFVIGYGLDYDGFGRNLKDIYHYKTD